MPAPTENTLTVNSTHQMLSDLEGTFSHLTAISPTREMENVLGYDINLPLLKSTVFQYKRPYTAKNDSERRFSVNSDQWRTLISQYEPRQAFFALPEVIQATNLPNSLEDRTVFVDVWGLKPNTSLIYVPQDAVGKGRLDKLKAKIRNGDTYPVDRRFVYTWKDLVQGMNSCSIGLRMSEDGERTPDYREFKSRVQALADKDLEKILDRIESVAVEQKEYYQYSIEDGFISRLQQRLNQLVETDTDLTVHGIRRSQHTMLGR